MNYRGVFTLSERNDYFAKLNLAQKLKNQNKWLSAANVLEDLVSISPEDPGAYIELSGLYLHRNEVEYAQKFLLQAYNHFPENTEILFMLGNSYLIAGNQEREALHYYNQITISFPELHYNKGLAYSRLSHHQEAINSMEKALQHSGRQHQCYFILVHEFNILRNHQKVLDTVRRAEQNGIHSGYLYFMAGLSNNHLKQHFQSAKYFQLAIKHGYDDPQAFRSLARAYSDLGLANQHH